MLILSNITIFKFSLNLAIAIEPVKRKDSRCNSYRRKELFDTCPTLAVKASTKNPVFFMCPDLINILLYFATTSNHEKERTSYCWLKIKKSFYILLYILPSQATLPNSTSKYFLANIYQHISTYINIYRHISTYINIYLFF